MQWWLVLIQVREVYRLNYLHPLYFVIIRETLSSCRANNMEYKPKQSQLLGERKNLILKSVIFVNQIKICGIKFTVNVRLLSFYYYFGQRNLINLFLQETWFFLKETMSFSYMPKTKNIRQSRDLILWYTDEFDFDHNNVIIPAIISEWRWLYGKYLLNCVLTIRTLLHSGHRKISCSSVKTHPIKIETIDWV